MVKVCKLWRLKSRGARTNLKVGGHQSGVKVGGRGTDPTQSSGLKNFCWSCPSTFLALKVQLLVLVSTFTMVSTVWSVSSLLLYTHGAPCPAIFKSGGHVPPCPMEPAPLLKSVLYWLVVITYIDDPSLLFQNDILPSDN